MSFSCWIGLLTSWWLLKEPFCLRIEVVCLVFLALGWFPCLLLAFLRKQNSLNVWQNTSLCDRDASKELVQLFVIAYGKLKMTRNNSRFLVIASCIACQFQDFGGQVLQNSGKINWSASANPLCVVSFAKKAMNSANWKLQARTRRATLRFRSLSFTFSSSRHLNVSLDMCCLHDTQGKFPCVLIVAGRIEMHQSNVFYYVAINQSKYILAFSEVRNINYAGKCGTLRTFLKMYYNMALSTKCFLYRMLPHLTRNQTRVAPS